MTQLLLTRDKAGESTFSIMPSGDMTSTTLAQEVAQSFVVPAAFANYQLNFSIDPGLRVFISYNGVAATIPGAAFASTNCELNPAARTVPGGSTISCITPDTSAYIGVAMYGF